MTTVCPAFSAFAAQKRNTPTNNNHYQPNTSQHEKNLSRRRPAAGRARARLAGTDGRRQERRHRLRLHRRDLVARRQPGDAPFGRHLHPRRARRGLCRVQRDGRELRSVGREPGRLCLCGRGAQRSPDHADRRQRCLWLERGDARRALRHRRPRLLRGLHRHGPQPAGRFHGLRRQRLLRGRQRPVGQLRHHAGLQRPVPPLHRDGQPRPARPGAAQPRRRARTHGRALHRALRRAQLLARRGDGRELRLCPRRRSNAVR